MLLTDTDLAFNLVQKRKNKKLVIGTLFFLMLLYITYLHYKLNQIEDEQIKRTTAIEKISRLGDRG